MQRFVQPKVEKKTYLF